jgi:hypothetical protein
LSICGCNILKAKIDVIKPNSRKKIDIKLRQSADKVGLKDLIMYVTVCKPVVTS